MRATALHHGPLKMRQHPEQAGSICKSELPLYRTRLKSELHPSEIPVTPVHTGPGNSLQRTIARYSALEQ